jgi:hypothetical protein
MVKLTRRNRKIKKGGNSIEENEDRKGIVDIIGNKIGDSLSSMAQTATDAGLKIAGLERINKEKESSENIESNEPNLLDKTGSSLLQNVNEVLGSDEVKQTTKEVAQETASILKDGAKIFNDSLNEPEVREELEKAINNAGEIGSVVVKASEKPFEEMVDVAAKAVPKASGAAVSGLIKVGTDAMAAIPYVGSVIELGKMLNDGSKAASSVVEAGSEFTEVASDAFIETKENVEKGLRELEEKKKMAQQIANRTSNSINEFENSNRHIVGGKNEKNTRKRLFNKRKMKSKLKSKRVRFAV